MAIPKPVSRNYQTLMDACAAGKVVLLECQNKETGKECYVLCALSRGDGKEYDMVPFAQMFDSDPYEILNPPNPDGGLYGTE